MLPALEQLVHLVGCGLGPTEVLNQGAGGAEPVHRVRQRLAGVPAQVQLVHQQRQVVHPQGGVVSHEEHRPCHRVNLRTVG
eukprot:48198-Prorocentrum_minimum.AAC.2